MNNRYLFKAKRISDGEWIVGYLYRLSENNPPFIMLRKYGESYEVDEHTICQCTGLKDKNGKLIWENDILSGHIDDDFPENETKKYVLWHENGWHTKEINSVDYEALDNFDSENFEVVGNIFENPKLWKEGENMNREGYRDDVAETAIRNVTYIPRHINEVYAALNKVASLHSLEIVGLRDKKTGKEFRK